MVRVVTWCVVLFLLLAGAATAEDAKTPAAFSFDHVNAPLGEALAQAKAEKKLVFLDFFLEG